MRTAAIISLALLACLALAGAPVFAQEPREETGKQDSPVSLLLQRFIDQRETTSAEADSQSDSGAVTRSRSGDGLTTKDAPAADSAPSKSDTTDDPVRFDSSGNVQVYIHLENTDEETLQELRDLGVTQDDCKVTEGSL